jgi:hypothetical protein
MKTTEKVLTQNELTERKILLKPTLLQTRSIRPAKSMVRLRSLKPKRIDLGTTLRRKPIKA